MSCDNCGKNTKGNFICINGGALLQDKNDPTSAGMSDYMDEFLNITTHNNNDKIYKTVHIVPYNEDGYGQFEWYFCNKKCLKEYFNKYLEKVTDI